MSIVYVFCLFYQTLFANTIKNMFRFKIYRLYIICTVFDLGFLSILLTMSAINNLKDVVILCVGTTSITGDSLGPRVGDLLINDYNVNAFVYGSSHHPVNGLNYNDYIDFLKKHHKNSLIIAVDACLGEFEDVGKIKYTFNGLRAGAALNKNMEKIGDIAILGIVAEKCSDNFYSLSSASSDIVELLSQKIAMRIFHLTSVLKKAC